MGMIRLSARSCEIADKQAMQLRSSRLQRGFSNFQPEQNALNRGVTSSTSAQKVFTSKSESETDLCPSSAQTIPSLSRSGSARRYDLRSRPGEILSKQLPQFPRVLSKKSKLRAIKRQKSTHLSPTDEPRTCPICIERRLR